MSPATANANANVTTNHHHHQFFTVYQPQHCSHQLQIPREFEKRIGIAGKIPRRVILRNSEGKLWAVELRLYKNDDDEVGGLFLFGGGWSKFAVDHCLAFGEFLVFKYNGHHVFDVLILGIDGCERGLVARQHNAAAAAAAAVNHNVQQDISNKDDQDTNSEFDQADDAHSDSDSDFDDCR